MRSAFLLVLLGSVLAAGTALAGPPGDQGVTILRGSSAPPPPPPPAPPAEPTVVQREVVYAPYPVYALPDFVIPGVIVTTHHHRPLPPVTTTPLPNGWPLFQGKPFR